MRFMAGFVLGIVAGYCTGAIRLGRLHQSCSCQRLRGRGLDGGCFFLCAAGRTAYGWRAGALVADAEALITRVTCRQAYASRSAGTHLMVVRRGIVGRHIGRASAATPDR